MSKVDNVEEKKFNKTELTKDESSMFSGYCSSYSYKINETLYKNSNVSAYKQEINFLDNTLKNPIY